jgi:NAD(P)-dependent dehydrogenase (short-subunit alcohol dehydrogenase family)
MPSSRPTPVVLAFTGLNVALWWYAVVIPVRDVAFSVTAFLLVTFIVIQLPFDRQVTLNKTDTFNRWFPILSLSEFTFFLVIPWALLIGFQSEKSVLAYVLSSHLWIVQTQIALEPALMSRKRHGALFWYIFMTNAYRGVGIATWIRRYLESRQEISRENMTKFMDVYTTLALAVWLFSNAIIAFVWYPCLAWKDSTTGLRIYKGAVAIITGAASGIGRAIAEELADRGAQAVVLVDRQKALAEEVAAGLQRKGVKTAVHDVDVRNFSDVQEVVNETKEVFGRLDYMFNNAGVLIIGPIDKIGVENFDYIFDVNVRGIHHGCQAAYCVMKEQGFGHIVNTSSLLGLIPGGQWAVAYSASKHAITGLSTNLRIEAANHGIRVSLFCPGTIETPIHTGGAFGKNLTGIPKEAWDAQVAKAHMMDAKLCATKTLDAVAKNKPIIIVPALPMIRSRLFYRLSPSMWIYLKENRFDWRKKLVQSVAQGRNKDE